MPRTFIVTLGFDQSHVVRLIGERGLSPGDVIYVVTSAVSHPRAENAIRSITEFANTLNPKIDVRVLRLRETDVEDNIAMLSRLIMDSEEPVIDITGGPKGLSISLFLAACFAGVREVYMTTETLGERVRIPTLVVPTYTLTKRQREVLGLLPCRVSELSRRLGVSKSTASRLLRSLVSKGLAYRSSRNVFKLTLAGKVILRMLESEESFTST